MRPSKPQKPLPTASETAKLDAERATAARERATASLTRARVAYRVAERAYAKARELERDALDRVTRLTGA